MDYFLSNGKVYIRLNKNGTPETCVKKAAQRFPYDKAKNILTCLPKDLKKYHLKAIAIPEIPAPTPIRTQSKLIQPVSKPKKIIVRNDYIVPESVVEWKVKVESCNGLAKEALDRKCELIEAFGHVSNHIIDIQHEIELTEKVNAAEGFKLYRKMKNALRERRLIKDELEIVCVLY